MIKVQKDDFDIKEHIKDLKEMSLEDYEKIIEVFSHVDFCGQIGDPIFHTQFHKLLEMSKNVPAGQGPGPGADAPVPALLSGCAEQVSRPVTLVSGPP